MDPLMALLRTIIDFIVRIVTLVLEMMIYVLNFAIGLIHSLANSF